MPDWSADWLHREAVALLEIWAEREHRRAFDELPAEWQAALRHRLEREMRTNSYDSETDRVTVSADRAQAMARVHEHYSRLFSNDPEKENLREQYAIANDAIPAAEHRDLLPAGIYQAYWSITEGLWYARSPEIIHTAWMRGMVWTRVPGDIIFAAGAVVLAWFTFRLWAGSRGLPVPRSRLADAIREPA